MAKTPIAGGVKRRLGREIGATASVNFYRTCLAQTLRRLGSDRRWQSYLAISPDGDLRASIWNRLARPRVVRLAQGRGDLGARMQRLFCMAPLGPAIIVGSDIPAVSADEIGKAFRLLGKVDAVLGPARDGGYWLIGLRRRPRLLSPFASVRWSTDRALGDTLTTLAGCKIAFVATLEDVDDARAHDRYRPHWQRLIPPRSFARPRRASGNGA
jgi:rSAM/selenodomain-associated transferase 1